MQPHLDKTNGLLFWSGLGVLAVLLGFLLWPTLHLGFVADDFFLLVPDQKLPLTESPDELHRPLRNVTIKLVEHQIGIQSVAPYRVLVALTFVATLALLFLLLRRLGAKRFAALAAVFFLAFHPRNQEVLYWFAAWQDLVAAAGALLACVLFLDFRETGRSGRLIAAALAYAVAIGFKETIVVLPALLVAIDFYRARSFDALFRSQFWKAYLPFTGILLLYAVYFFSRSGVASLAGHKTGGYYGFHGIGGIIAGIVRALLNIAAPFSTSFGLKDLRVSLLLIVLLKVAIILLLVWRLRLWPALLLMLAWLLCTILPTATFAAAFNADRYLFVPLLGVAIFVGLLVHAVLVSSDAVKYTPVVCVALALYAAAGMYQLVMKRELWRKAGVEFASVVGDALRLGPQLRPGGEIDFINMTHSYHPTGQVFANGLSEALHAHAFPRSVRILRNLAGPEQEQQNLVSEISRCEGSLPGLVRERTIVVERDGQLKELDPGCAAIFVDADRVLRPLAWGKLYPLP